MGSTAVIVHRAELHRILRDALPAEVLTAGVETTSIVGGDPAQIRYRRGGEETSLQADLVVGADGVHSWVRSQCWPQAAGPVFSGSTAWRAVTDAPPQMISEMSMSWGAGTEFGVMPMVDRAAMWQLRFGQQLRNPMAVALRNALVALTPDHIALRAAARYGAWTPHPLRRRGR